MIYWNVNKINPNAMRNNMDLIEMVKWCPTNDTTSRTCLRNENYLQ